jgi:hypothetical protein
MSSNESESICHALLTFDKANRSTLFYACANAR